MTMNRLIQAAAVAVAVMTTAVSCGDSENTPGATPTAEAPAAPAAQAGSGPATPRIVFFDRDSALQLSLAGKSMIAQVQQLKRQVEQELQGEGRRLEADFRAFQQQQAILAAGVRASRERELRNRQAALQRKAQARTEQIQYGFRKALEEFSVKVQPVLQQIMTERGANLLLDRSVVLMSQSMSQFDITAAAVERMNQTVKTIPVKLATPPQQTPGQPGAPTAATAPRPPGQ
jgi:outer membrane protein